MTRRETSGQAGSCRDALIIGGGLAGSSLAIWLARAGRSTVLVEKSSGPHPKVCGEFLSHEALHYLRDLGLDLRALGAVPIDAVRLISRRSTARARLPFGALSLSRERLDEALLARAAAEGVSVLRGARVQSLVHNGARWSARLQSEETLAGQTAFLATGKHDLHGWNRPSGVQHDLVAFKMQWQLAAQAGDALAGHVELILFAGGYAGLQPVEEGAVNLCLLVNKSTFRRGGATWAGLLAHMQLCSPHLASRLSGAKPMWEAPLSLGAIPYGFVREGAEDGLWRLGDQAAVIPSFAGDGMSIALHSARIAAGTYCAGGDAHHYQQQMAAHTRRQVGLATTLSRLLISQPELLAFGARFFPAALSFIASRTRIRQNKLV